jgi:hypothetical protein
MLRRFRVWFVAALAALLVLLAGTPAVLHLLRLRGPTIVKLESTEVIIHCSHVLMVTEEPVGAISRIDVILNDGRTIVVLKVGGEWKLATNYSDVILVLPSGSCRIKTAEWAEINGKHVSFLGL